MSFSLDNFTDISLSSLTFPLSSPFCYKVHLVNFLFRMLYFSVPKFLFGLIFFFLIFIFLFLSVLGLRFCARALSGCGKWGPLFIAVRGPLTVAASLVAEHRLQTRRLSSCGPRAQSLRGTWDPPRPGPEPAPPALAGRLPITAPPGKPLVLFL